MDNSIYESPRVLSEYLLFHYGRPEEILPFPFGPREACDFPARCVNECLDRTGVEPGSRALELGCAVGRASFELARYVSEVVGVDRSLTFIAAARRLQATGTHEYAYAEEGALRTAAVASVPSGIDRTRVHFECGNAERLRADLGNFAVVLMANLLDRMQNPRACLEQLPGLVKPGGQLIITSPYTWLEGFTPAQNWLGGFETGAGRVKTIDTLEAILGRDFVLVDRRDLAFLIREHARKYQWGVAEATRWLRR